MNNISKTNKVIHNTWKIIPNPYRVGFPIESDDVFVGRVSLIKEVIAELNNNTIYMIGKRRIGKTSILKYIQRHYLSTEESITIFLSAEKMLFDSTNNFLRSFSGPIANEFYKSRFISKDNRNDYLNAIRENGLVDFGLFFDDILNLIKTQNKTLVLIIDDYSIIQEAITDNRIDSQFLEILREYHQNNSNGFKLIYSGSSSLKYLTNLQSKDKMGIGKSIEVSYLDVKDVRMLISNPTNDQMHFEDDAFLYLMDITQGHPFFVQFILSYLVDLLNRENNGSIILKKYIESGMKYFLEQVLNFADDWNNDIYSENFNWNEKEVIQAKVYKQLIITAITDNWKEIKSGLKREEIFSILENSLTDYHKVNLAIFDEVINVLTITEDVIKHEQGLYFIKLGLFREWVIVKMNLTFNITLTNSKKLLTNKF